MPRTNSNAATIRLIVEAAPERGELLLDIRYQRRTDRVPRNLEIVL